jgi:hypothetical protein
MIVLRRKWIFQDVFNVLITPVLISDDACSCTSSKLLEIGA